MRKSSHLVLFISIVLMLVLLVGCASDVVAADPGQTSGATLPVVNSVPENTPTVSISVLYSPSPSPTLLLLITPTPAPEPTPTIRKSTPEQDQKAKTDPGDEIVYITNTGECYHRGSCRYLHSSKIETTKSQAIADGYRPCKVCKP